MHYESKELAHFGILGMKWGRRRFQNPDGSLTPAGEKRAKKLERARNMIDKIATKRSKKLGISKEEYEKRMSETSNGTLIRNHIGNLIKGEVGLRASVKVSDILLGRDENGQISKNVSNGRVIAAGLISGVGLGLKIRSLTAGSADRRYKQAQKLVEKYTKDLSGEVTSKKETKTTTSTDSSTSASAETANKKLNKVAKVAIGTIAAGTAVTAGAALARRYLNNNMVGSTMSSVAKKAKKGYIVVNDFRDITNTAKTVAGYLGPG